MTMQSHVNAIAKMCFYYLRNIARIRRNLSEEESKISVHNFVISRLDCSIIMKNVTQLAASLKKTMQLVW